MDRVEEIAFAFPRGTHQEVFIEGVLRFAREAGRDWSYLTAPETLSLSVLDLIGWPGDGVLAALNKPAEVEVAARLKPPVVNISSALATPSVPTSVVDNEAIGRLAAQHLLAKGFRTCAFYGLESVRYSADRQRGFEQALAAADAPCASFHAAPTFGLEGSGWMKQHEALAEWLAELPDCCGLMAVSDYRARQALDACRRIGRRVPDGLAVVGVDNEQVICEHSNPPLSSVSRNDELEGYRAAALLDALMRGQATDRQPPPVAPIEVVERASTATYAVLDSRLRAAMQYLHENLGDPITVDELTEHAGVSRRWLEYAFREAVGETPYQYLRRQRLMSAKRWLAEDRSLKVYEVARRCGFTSAKQLAAAFQQEFGLSPREWRGAQTR
ncbi:substrate-binding domain-containing protein [Botrimarina sp.]|uniref:AraC family transcriptional regulator n=1 Tax=Botrimarina sp. TaxID=2795802 RepID=UPI0032EF1A34